MKPLPVFAVLLTAAAGLAQKSTGPRVKSDRPPVVSLGPLTVARKPAQLGGPKEIGRHRPVPAGALRKGRWTPVPGGAPVWRLAIRSPGAKGIRVHLQAFDLGSGEVWIYSGDSADSRPAGPYSGKGPNQDGEFWSDVVSGAEAVIECRPAGRRAAGTPPPFRIPEISHLLEQM